MAGWEALAGEASANAAASQEREEQLLLRLLKQERQMMDLHCMLEDKDVALTAASSQLSSLAGCTPRTLLHLAELESQLDARTSEARQLQAVLLLQQQVMTRQLAAKEEEGRVLQGQTQWLEALLHAHHAQAAAQGAELDALQQLLHSTAGRAGQTVEGGGERGEGAHQPCGLCPGLQQPAPVDAHHQLLATQEQEFWAAGTAAEADQRAVQHALHQLFEACQQLQQPPQPQPAADVEGMMLSVQWADAQWAADQAAALRARKARNAAWQASTDAAARHQAAQFRHALDCAHLGCASLLQRSPAPGAPEAEQSRSSPGSPSRAQQESESGGRSGGEQAAAPAPHGSVVQQLQEAHACTHGCQELEAKLSASQAEAHILQQQAGDLRAAAALAAQGQCRVEQQVGHGLIAMEHEDNKQAAGDDEDGDGGMQVCCGHLVPAAVPVV
ncbi:hypothetical protein HaLaN_18488 [Haematococcus lacustris]|uniref:Uncharacterized protein n=1 Tax=Haematococcus lacustris TaxID=44745 RepID=A0A699ZJI5_HAELA|nr:hypothetical protein HaLaN_18488 [Haematococcus lacustris]